MSGTISYQPLAQLSFLENTYELIMQLTGSRCCYYRVDSVSRHWAKPGKDVVVTPGDGAVPVDYITSRDR